jgi:hypothetical protein
VHYLPPKTALGQLLIDFFEIKWCKNVINHHTSQKQSKRASSFAARGMPSAMASAEWSSIVNTLAILAIGITSTHRADTRTDAISFSWFFLLKPTGHVT